MNRDPSIEEAILNPELRHINFFNGRLLTGGDLEAEQRVQHAHARHLGGAIGAGVAFGLEVSRGDDSPPGAPVFVVSAGLALNRVGQTLRLECDQRIALVVPPEPEALDQCVFDDCLRTPGGTLASGTGYYVLTIAPASRPDGKAPVSGLGSGLATCNSRFLIEEVKFRVHRLGLALESTDKARGRLAQACFGLVPEIATGNWPAALPDEYGWQTLMPPAFRADLEVPLAVFEWNNAGLGLLKRWAVRRRLARVASAADWVYFASNRRVSEGEALFLDFQEDIAAINAQPANRTSSVDRWFELLPPAGILPEEIPWQSFLGPLAPDRATPIDPALFPAIVRESFAMEPVGVPALAGEAGAIFAALKVYQVPGRKESLFARSRLGRARIDLSALALENAMVILLLPDGSLRFGLFAKGTSLASVGFSGILASSADLVTNSRGGPLMFDDLPGGPMRILVFAEGPRSEDDMVTLTSSLFDIEDGSTLPRRFVERVARRMDEMWASFLEPLGAVLGVRRGQLLGGASVVVVNGRTLHVVPEPIHRGVER